MKLPAQGWLAVLVIALIPGSAQAAGVPTTTTLSASENPAELGEPVTLTATVGPVGALITPSGSVTFSDGERPLGVAPLNGRCVIAIAPCTAQLTVPSLAPGAHAMAAAYEGDALSEPSTGTLAEQVTYPEEPDFSLLPRESILAAVPGGSVTTSIATTPLDEARTTVDLSLSGLPAGAAATLEPASLRMGGATSLRITTGQAAPGRYPLVLTGVSGGVRHIRRLQLRIEPRSRVDFAVRVAQPRLSLTAGGHATTVLHTRAVRGTGKLKLHVKGVPRGSTVRLPGRVRAGGPARLTVVNRRTEPGQYTVKVVATEGSAKHAYPLVLTSTTNLNDNGGPIIPAAQLYSVWWGDQGAFAPDAKAGLESVLRGFDGTRFLATLAQYMRGQAVSARFVASATDTSSPPAADPEAAPDLIQAELAKVIHAQGWTPDPNAIYFVFTSNFAQAGAASYCGLHNYVDVDGVNVHYAYMPNLTAKPACAAYASLHCNTSSRATQAMASVASHELTETMTDPELDAWSDASGEEIGDKGAWQFDACVPLSTGRWQLQDEWDNAAKRAVQQAP